MSFPTELKYTKDHEWISAVTGTARIGVSAYAVEQLGDIVHVELPKVGQSFSKGAAFGTIESTKTVSDVYLPIAGRVVQINDALMSHPENLQEAPYAQWLIEIAVEGEAVGLLDAAGYEAFLAEDH